MSWHYSQALEAAFSEASSLGGERCAPLKSTGTDGIAFSHAKTTAPSRLSQSGMTFERSTDCNGADVLMWFLEAFPARRIAAQLEAGTLRMISGRKCGESWQRQLPGTYLRRTSLVRLSTQPQTTLRRWATRPDALPFQRATWVLTTFGNGIGFVHTPTETANYTCRSMQKWPNCRAFVSVFGVVSPEAHEWLMAWPEGWSALAPLAMDKYQSWLQRHGAC
jgi:hypothetical protein